MLKLIKKGYMLILLFTFLLSPSMGSVEFPDKDQPVCVLVIKGAIYEPTARYISRGIKEAEKEGAICIIEMDTPGGLLKSMRQIIQSITQAEVPVIVYIYPPGGMATSAGTYIAYASPITAMAPGTHIGSAHPIFMFFNNQQKKEPEEDPLGFKNIIKDEKEKKKSIQKNIKYEKDIQMEKITNAMVALIRALAEKNGKNADWGEKAVRKSVSITAYEAKKLNVVNIIAEDLPDLLEKLKGRSVTLPNKKTVTLYPSQDKIKYIRMTGVEKFLVTINDPQIALILLFLGAIGLYYELAHPGATLPGIVGGICIILGLYTLGSLPINYAALGLIILSIILFIAEIFTPTFGALTLGGIISFILGAVFLIPSDIPFIRISKALIISISIIMGAFSFVIVNVILKNLKRKPFSGKEGLIGKIATVKKDLTPKGFVLLQGELWKAISESDIIPAGNEVIVTDVKGLTLKVKPTPKK